MVVRLERADGRGPESGLGIARVDPQGRFQTNEVPPGKYVVRLTSTFSGWTAHLGGRDVSVAPIDVIDREIDTLVVTVGVPATQLSGTLIAPIGGADPDTLIFVFPTDRAVWSDYGRNPPHLMRVRIDRAGVFSVTGLPPGEYYVAALREDSAPDEWTDPAFLARLSGGAATVRLAPGSAATVNVQPGIVR
jgi:hypothetical protein